jgi:predicted DNA-binding transcriptional regulator AlpA
MSDHNQSPATMPIDSRGIVRDVALPVFLLPPGVRVPLAGPDDRLLAETSAAVFLGRSVRWLQRHRQHKTGPRHVLVGKRRFVYRQRDLEDWLASMAGEG